MRKLSTLFFVTNIVASTSDSLLPQCVHDRAESLPNNQWLNSRNRAAYLCTIETLSEIYKPENIACGQGGAAPADGVAAFVCPQNTTIQCVLNIGWGSVAGTCDACTDSCSIKGQSGAGSCCGASCVVDTDLCSGNTWEPGYTDTCGSENTDGFCSCCPNCANCKVYHPSDDSSLSSQVQVDSSICDCRAGLDTSPDWTPCWNSCQDCFGDGPQPTPISIPAYAPEALVSECLGKESCFIGNFYNFDSNGDVSNGTWALCTNSSVDSCTKDLNLTAKLDKGLSKFKGLMMCG